MNETPDTVSYIVYESAMVRAERAMKRIVIALIVAVALLFVSNALWLWYISQYDFESYEYSQDGQGINIIGDDNGVTYGESEGTHTPQG